MVLRFWNPVLNRFVAPGLISGRAGAAFTSD
jgi:hypothetical protein